MKKILIYWLPPVLWMVLIFTLSSRQRIGISEVYVVNFIVFKILHMIEYALLYFLFFRAIYSQFSHHKTFAFLFAGIATLLFAISDELHQTAVPSREGTLRDVGIDTIGITLCFMYTKYNLSKLRLFL